MNIVFPDAVTKTTEHRIIEASAFPIGQKNIENKGPENGEIEFAFGLTASFIPEKVEGERDS